MTTRKVKRKKFYLNKINRRMRQLRRKNKRKRLRTIKYSYEVFAIETYQYLKSVKFDDIPLGERIYLKNKTGSMVIKIPKIFSITKNCEETIAVLKRIFYYGCNDNTKKLIFAHNNCEELGIAASTIMDVIVMACEKYKMDMGERLAVSGDYPSDSKAKKMFIASGLPSHLKLQNKILYRKDNLKLFSMVAGKEGTSRSGEISTRLTDYIDKCLETKYFYLTKEGKGRISKMFSEIIENCEIHGGKNSTWYVLGHFNIEKDEPGEMNLVIFNFGNSIYERLIEEETTEETKEKMEYMRKKHKNEFDNQNWNDETMITLLSLQQGISRLRDKNSEGNKKRGNGTFRLLEIFHYLGNTIEDREPEISITSGHTHIVIDKNYKLKKETMEDTNIWGKGERAIIAFNKDNDLLKKPDGDNVKYMKNQKFPGTIISMKFYIDGKYLKLLKEKSND